MHRMSTRLIFSGRCHTVVRYSVMQQLQSDHVDLTVSKLSTYRKKCFWTKSDKYTTRFWRTKKIFSSLVSLIMIPQFLDDWFEGFCDNRFKQYLNQRALKKRYLNFMKWSVFQFSNNMSSFFFHLASFFSFLRMSSIFRNLCWDQK